MPLYVCPIIGTGTALDPYRPALRSEGVTGAARIPTDINGAPVDKHCVVAVDKILDAGTAVRAQAEEVVDCDAATLKIEAKRGDVLKR